MKRKMTTLLILIIISISIVILTYFRFTSNNELIWITVTSSILLSFSVKPYVNYVSKVFTQSNWEIDLHKLIRNKEISKKDYIRISYAYLYRIKIDNKYLLINNIRFNKYQPVGGVYKYTDEFKKLYMPARYIYSDNHIIDETTDKDFRLNVSVSKIKKFYKNFNKGVKYRENGSNILREFKEEVLKNSNTSVKSKFNNVNTHFIGRHMQGITYSSFFGTYEMLLADIYELEFNKEQEKLLKDIIKDNANFLLENEALIKTMGVDTAKGKYLQTITEHSFKILESTNKELIDVKNKYI